MPRDIEAEHAAEYEGLQQALDELRKEAATLRGRLAEAQCVNSTSVSNEFVARMAALESENTKLKAALLKIPPQRLRTLAEWFDTYDRLQTLEDSGPTLDAWLESHDELRERQSTEVQEDLRLWADILDAALGEKNMSTDTTKSAVSANTSSPCCAECLRLRGELATLQSVNSTSISAAHVMRMEELEAENKRLRFEVDKLKIHQENITEDMDEEFAKLRTENATLCARIGRLRTHLMRMCAKYKLLRAERDAAHVTGMEAAAEIVAKYTDWAVDAIVAEIRAKAKEHKPCEK